MTQRHLVDLPVSDDPRRKLRGLIGLLVLLVVSLSLVSAVMLWEMRLEAWKAGVIASRNIVTAEAGTIEQTLRIYDASLRSAAEAANAPDVVAAAPGMRQRALFDRIQDPSFLGPIRILDQDGHVTADSADLALPAPSGAELEALARHRSDPTAGPAIGPPMPDGTDHAVTVSRRITLPDGRFGGIVCGTIRLGYLTDRFRHLRIGPHDVISLFLGDGVMLAHAPGDPLVGRRITGSAVMQHFSERSAGTVVTHSAVDGIERVFTFAHLSGWPLLVDVGLSVSDLYAPWRERAAIIGLLLGVMVIAGGLLALALRHEINERLVAEEASRRSEAQYRALADGASDIILRLDANLVRTYASPSVRTFGYEPHELIGGSPHDWIHTDDVGTFRHAFDSASTGCPQQVVGYRIRRRDGDYTWVEARFSPLGGGEMLAILRDVDERKRMEFELEAAREELVRLATIDSLTGLSNRRNLDRTLEHELRRAEREATEIAVLLIDVDHFKSFNDRYGHLAGDEALRAVGQAISMASRRPGDLAARFGGEEFALVLPNTDIFGAISVAEAIRAAVADAAIFHEAAERRRLTVSIGVSSARPASQAWTAKALLQHADEALYDAKRFGRNTVRTFPPAQIAAGGHDPAPPRIL